MFCKIACLCTIFALVGAIQIPCEFGDEIGYGRMGREVKIGDANEQYDAYITEPNGTSKGGVIVLHDVWGWTLSNTRAMVDMLAKNGFTGIMPDAFYGLPPRSRDTPFSVQSFMTFLEKRPTNGTKKIVDMSIDYMKANYNVTQFGIMGFCWGGTGVHHLVVDNARDDVKVGVSCYGRPLENPNHGDIKTPTLFVYGRTDSGIPMEQVKKLRSSLKANSEGAYKVRAFEGQGHGFVHRKKDVEGDPFVENINRARRVIIRWFQKYLK